MNLKQFIEEDGQAEVVCHFCNEKYVFDRPQLEDAARTSEAETDSIIGGRA